MSVKTKIQKQPTKAPQPNLILAHSNPKLHFMNTHAGQSKIVDRNIRKIGHSIGAALPRYRKAG
jgi:hypothetical protein